jgi:hypothetical protein
MANLDMGTTGAKRVSWATENPRSLLLDLIKENPTWGYDGIEKLFIEKAGDNPDMVTELARYYFAHTWRSIHKERSHPHSTAATRAETAIKISKTKEIITEKLQTILLDLILPNGKALRHCTGRDCRKAGGWYTLIANKIKPNEVVGNKFNEPAMRELWKKAVLGS